MRSEDFKSFITAIVLSLMVLVGWQYFFAAPIIEQQKQQIKTEKIRDSVLPSLENNLAEQKQNEKPTPRIKNQNKIHNRVPYP